MGREKVEVISNRGSENLWVEYLWKEEWIIENRGRL